MALRHSYGEDFSNICQEDVTVHTLHFQPFAKQREKDETGAGAGKRDCYPIHTSLCLA